MGTPTKYDYIQISEIFMFPNLQRWRRQNHCHWLDLDLLKTNFSTWIK